MDLYFAKCFLDNSFGKDGTFGFYLFESELHGDFAKYQRPQSIWAICCHMFPYKDVDSKHCLRMTGAGFPSTHPLLLVMSFPDVVWTNP